MFLNCFKILSLHENIGLKWIKKFFTFGIYPLQVNDKNSKTRGEICSKIRTKTQEQLQCRWPGVFAVNF